MPDKALAVANTIVAARMADRDCHHGKAIIAIVKDAVRSLIDTREFEINNRAYTWVAGNDKTSVMTGYNLFDN